MTNLFLALDQSPADFHNVCNEEHVSRSSLDPAGCSDLARWVEFQRSYRMAKEAGRTDGEAHAAMTSQHDPADWPRNAPSWRVFSCRQHLANCPTFYYYCPSRPNHDQQTKDMMMLDKPPSTSVNETVPRSREYLTENEIDKLMATARQDSRYGHRDATAILVAFKHGLRASELCTLEWDQIDLTRKTIRIHRAKSGDPSTHYLGNSELRALRRLQRENPPGPHVFVSERGGPVTTAWFRKMFARLGERSRMPFPIHPHMLRHSCGYKFANEGKDTRSLQAYLGHRSINSTVRYTAMAPNRFRGWEKE